MTTEAGRGDDRRSIERELKRGSLELIVLHLLAPQEAYGYEIVSKLTSQTNGALEVTDGTLYPVLYRLERAGFVAVSVDAVTDGAACSAAAVVFEPAFLAVVFFAAVFLAVVFFVAAFFAVAFLAVLRAAFLAGAAASASSGADPGSATVSAGAETTTIAASSALDGEPAGAVTLRVARRRARGGAATGASSAAGGSGSAGASTTGSGLASMTTSGSDAFGAPAGAVALRVARRRPRPTGAASAGGGRCLRDRLRRLASAPERSR